jgi:hypothetical protein
LISLKMQSGRLLKDTLVANGPNPTKILKFSSSRSFAYLNCGKWVERGVHQF